MLEHRAFLDAVDAVGQEHGVGETTLRRASAVSSNIVHCVPFGLRDRLRTAR